MSVEYNQLWLSKSETFVLPKHHHINSLMPRPNRRHFADDIFKCIFQNENEWISPRISLKFVPKVRINKIPALVQIMAWRRPGDKPLSESMLVSLPTHICVTRPQWVNTFPAIMIHCAGNPSVISESSPQTGKGQYCGIFHTVCTWSSCWKKNSWVAGDFVEWNVAYFISDFTEVCSERSNWQ